MIDKDKDTMIYSIIAVIIISVIAGLVFIDDRNKHELCYKKGGTPITSRYGSTVCVNKSQIIELK